MVESYDRDKFSVLVTVKIKYSSGYTKFLTTGNKIFFQDMYFVEVSPFLFLCFSCFVGKKIDFRV